MEKKKKGGSAWCSAPNCKHSRDKGWKMHSFPKNEERCQQWVQNCGREDLYSKSADYLNSTCHLCSDHFEDNQYWNVSKKAELGLLPTAVPTIFNIPDPPPGTAARGPEDDHSHTPLEVPSSTKTETALGEDRQRQSEDGAATAAERTAPAVTSETTRATAERTTETVMAETTPPPAVAETTTASEARTSAAAAATEATATSATADPVDSPVSAPPPSEMGVEQAEPSSKADQTKETADSSSKADQTNKDAKSSSKADEANDAEPMSPQENAESPSSPLDCTADSDAGTEGGLLVPKTEQRVSDNEDAGEPVELSSPQQGSTPEKTDGSRTGFRSSFLHSPAYLLWKHVGDQHKLKGDEEIACFLLRFYADTTSMSLSGLTVCPKCGNSLSACCTHCKHIVLRHPSSTSLVESSSEVTPSPSKRSRRVKRRRKPSSSDEAPEMLDEGDLSDNGNDSTTVEVKTEADELSTWGWFDASTVNGSGDADNVPLQVKELSEHLTKAVSKPREPRKTRKKTAKTPAVHKKVAEVTESGEKRFSCDTCGRSYSYMKNLNQHYRRKHASASAKFDCGVCNQSFSSEKNLQAHHDRQHAVKEIKCDVCGKTFTNTHSLKLHRLLHTGQQPFVCEICGKAVLTKLSLSRHMQIHTQQKEYLPCDVCSKVFDNPDALKRHKKRHADFRYVCDICGKAFFRATSLKEHQRTHREDKYMCDVCNMSFTDRTARNEHRAQHPEKKPFACDLCGKSYTAARNLWSHKRMHSGLMPTYTCDECGKTFTHSSALKRHRAVHTDEKPFSCDICTARFKLEYECKYHKKLHSHLNNSVIEARRSVPCDECGKICASKSSLYSHKLTHSGKKNYSCDMCPKSFCHSSTLVAHKNIHLGIKPYGCNVCGKKFTISANCKRHMRTHTGEKPFSCDVCGKCFAQKVQMEAHKRTHTGNRPFECELCGKTFPDPRSRRRHREKNHPVGPMGLSLMPI